MAINWKSPSNWRTRNRNILTDYNGLMFSLAWKKDGKWETFFRKFHLEWNDKMLKGKYPSNLHFNESLNLTENNCIMIYGVPKDLKYEMVKKNFEEENLEFLIFKEIFIIGEIDIKFYLPNLKYKVSWSVRLNGVINKKSTLELEMYKKKQLPFTEDKPELAIMLPRFYLDIKDISDFCFLTKDKYD